LDACIENAGLTRTQYFMILDLYSNHHGDNLRGLAARPFNQQERDQTRSDEFMEELSQVDEEDDYQHTSNSTSQCDRDPVEFDGLRSNQTSATASPCLSPSPCASPPPCHSPTQHNAARDSFSPMRPPQPHNRKRRASAVDPFLSEICETTKNASKSLADAVEVIKGSQVNLDKVLTAVSQGQQETVKYMFDVMFQREEENRKRLEKKEEENRALLLKLLDQNSQQK
jgi:hypothetical protein